jgi:transposase
VVPDNNYSFWPCALSQVHFNRFATWQHRVIVEQCHEALLCFSLWRKGRRIYFSFGRKSYNLLLLELGKIVGNVNAV